MNEFTRYANLIAKAVDGIDRQANAAAERVGLGALKSARSVVPVDSGDLRKSLTFRRQGAVATVTSDLPYSAFQEFGTSQMAPSPFIGPAATEWGPRLEREVEEIRDGVVKKL